MKDADYRYFRRALRERYGLAFPKSSERSLRAFFGRWIARQARARGFADISKYRRHLKRSGDAEWDSLLDLLDISRGRFFRQSSQFRELERLLPKGGRRRLRIWSAGCGRGEEAYSIALLLEGLKPRRDYRIDATDLRRSQLAFARAGIYPRSRVLGEVPAARRPFFRKVTGGSSRYLRIDPRVARRIRFAAWNLLAGRPKRARYDVIFCRNVLFYMDEKTANRVLRDLIRALEPGGLLFLSRWDRQDRLPPGIQREKSWTYRRV